MSPEQRWQADYDAGKASYQRGQYAEAEKMFAAAVDDAQGFGADDLRLAKSLHNLAAVYGAQGKYAKAAPLYARALAILEKAEGPGSPDVATCMENYAAVLRELGRRAEAEQLEARARAMQNTAVPVR